MYIMKKESQIGYLKIVKSMLNGSSLSWLQMAKDSLQLSIMDVLVTEKALVRTMIKSQPVTNFVNCSGPKIIRGGGTTFDCAVQINDSI